MPSLPWKKQVDQGNGPGKRRHAARHRALPGLEALEHRASVSTLLTDLGVAGAAGMATATSLVRRQKRRLDVGANPVLFGAIPATATDPARQQAAISVSITGASPSQDVPPPSTAASSRLTTTSSLDVMQSAGDVAILGEFPPLTIQPPSGATSSSGTDTAGGDMAATASGTGSTTSFASDARAVMIAGAGALAFSIMTAGATTTTDELTVSTTEIITASEPSTPSTFITSVTLQNTSATATPATTYVPFGHPFVKGDVAATRHVEATWTPAGGVENPVAIQLSDRVSWTDGSLKFATIGVALPTVPGSGTGTLKLYAADGPQPTALPGGRTESQVRAELQSNHSFLVSANNLHKGRENIRIQAAGAGYPAARGLQGNPASPPLPLTFTGGSPVQTATGGAITDGAGQVIYAWINQPALPYTVAPTVTVDAPSATAANLVVNIAPPDGSGAWTWSANAQLSLPGGLDARGRTRSEVIESGPLFVTFASWGPFVDNATGASHPHLAVRAWHRAWLDQTTGAIDRVEYLHNVEQGWVDDLNGGTTTADLETGDFAITINGAAVPGRSWSRVNIPHHSIHPLTTIDDANPTWTTAGSDWTSGASRLKSTFDNSYWVRSSVMPNYDVAYFAANPIRPAQPATLDRYSPDTQDPSGRFSSKGSTGGWMSINIGGESEAIGLLPSWSVRAFASQDPSYLRNDMATALFAGHMTMYVRNSNTGRLPKLTPDSLLTVPALGADRHATTFYYHAAANKHSPDIRIVANPSGDGTFVYWSTNDPTNTEGGWYGSGEAWNTSHMPNADYYAYLRTGAPWLLELLKLQANQGLMFQSPGSSGGRILSNALPGGASLYGRIIGLHGERVEAWAWRQLVQCLAILPDAAVERPYFERIYTDNQDAAVHRINTGSDNFRSLGTWNFPTGAYGTPQLNYRTSPWMQQYVFWVRAWEYLVMDRPAKTLTFLQHHARFWREMYGGGPTNTDAWTVSTYATFTGIEGGDYYPSVAQMPQFIDYPLDFDGATGWIGRTGGASLGFYEIPFRVGDRVLFHELGRGGASLSAFPPSTGARQDDPGTQVAIVPYQFYYLAEIDATNKRFRVSTDPTGLNPFVSFSASPTSVGSGWRLSVSPTPNFEQPQLSGPHSFDVRNAGATAGHGLAMSEAIAHMAILVGVAQPTDVWVQNVIARVAAARVYNNWAGNYKDWSDNPKHKFASAASLAQPEPDPSPTPLPSLAIQDVLIAEGNTGTTDAVFTVTLSLPATAPVSVDYTTAGGEATTGVDFQPISGTLTIPAGQTAVNLRVPVMGDPTVEPDETFGMTLSAPAGANLDRAVATGTITNDDAPPKLPWSYDFGTVTSPLAAGYTRVAASTRFGAAGYGWASGVIAEVDRGAMAGASDLTRDLNYTTDGTFAVAVPAGTYDVTLTMGDAAYAQDKMAVDLEGKRVATVATLAGQFSVKTYRVAVKDGQLTARLRDLGGKAPYAVINSLQVAPVGDTRGPRVSEVSPTGSTPGPVDHITLTFSESIQDGSFTLDDVSALSGPGGPIAPTAVNRLDATHYDVVFPAQSQAGTYSLTVGPDIRDLFGNRMDQDQDGVTGESTDDRFVTTISLAPPTAWSFDFGTATSPLAAGYTRVTASTRFDGAGHGWSSGTIAQVDRGAMAGTSDLTRDLNYSLDGTFAVAVPAGTYDVTLTMGDAAYAQDKMAVDLEGNRVAIVTTVAGEFAINTYRVAVSDGQLTVRLLDLGGTAPYAVINGLQMTLVVS